MARVQVVKEVPDPDAGPGSWTLVFQWCNYVLDEGELERGYRFIWRRPDGSLQAARGQARIPSVKKAEQLIALAREAGWGEYEG